MSNIHCRDFLLLQLVSLPAQSYTGSKDLHNVNHADANVPAGTTPSHNDGLHLSESKSAYLYLCVTVPATTRSTCQHSSHQVSLLPVHQHLKVQNHLWLGLHDIVLPIRGNLDSLCRAVVYKPHS